MFRGRCDDFNTRTFLNISNEQILKSCDTAAAISNDFQSHLSKSNTRVFGCQQSEVLSTWLPVFLPFMQLKLFFFFHLTVNCSAVMDVAAHCPSLPALELIFLCSLFSPATERKKKTETQSAASFHFRTNPKVQDLVTCTNQTCRGPLFALRRRLSPSFISRA